MHLVKDGQSIKFSSLGNGAAQGHHFLEDIPRGIIYIYLSILDLIHPSIYLSMYRIVVWYPSHKNSTEWKWPGNVRIWLLGGNQPIPEISKNMAQLESDSSSHCRDNKQNIIETCGLPSSKSFWYLPRWRSYSLDGKYWKMQGPLPSHHFSIRLRRVSLWVRGGLWTQRGRLHWPTQAGLQQAYIICTYNGKSWKTCRKPWFIHVFTTSWDK